MGSVVYGCTKLVIAQLYPAYASFKAVKNRNVKEYVKWMIYWIVFSAYTVLEEMTDIFIYWLPLYYEIKILILFWLVSPTTRGSSVLYRGLIHPLLVNKEDEIDQYLTDAIDKTYSLSVRYARLAAQKVTKAMIETAIRGGGGIVTTLRRSVSMNDLSQSEEEEEIYKGRGKARNKQRALMTMSWHEAQAENSSSIFDPDDEDGYSSYSGYSSSVHYSASQYSQPPHKSRKAPSRAAVGHSTALQLRNSSPHSSTDRQYQSNLASRRLRKEDNEISSSSEKLYSTLPRAKATRSHTRRQELSKSYKAGSGRPSPTLLPDRQADRLADRPDRLVDRQADRLADRQTDRIAAIDSPKVGSLSSTDNTPKIKHLTRTKMPAPKPPHQPASSGSFSPPLSPAVAKPPPALSKSSSQEDDFSMAFSDPDQKKNCSQM